ncbi:MAG: hypothetical protein KDK62_02445 [Chlamydiia bacterium]|nr:hypothetical protein [Chlamydiia bacterium]
MMKRLFAMAAFLAVSMNGFAASQDDPWSVTGEFLYFKPSFDDTYFVNSTDDEIDLVAHGTRYNNDFSFKPGFRVAVGYDFCNCSCPGQLSASYSYLSASEHKSVSGDALCPNLGIPRFMESLNEYTGTAESRLKLRYQRADLVFVQPLCNCNCLKLSFKGGLEYANLKLEERAVYNGSVGEIVTLMSYKSLSNVDAIGPELGLVFDYPLIEGSCECPGTLSLRGETTGSLLAADQKGYVMNTLTLDTDPQFGVKYNNQDSWRVIPALHARLGLNYAFALECFEGSAEIGYEFTSYIRGLCRANYSDDVAACKSFNQYDNFDLQGLYVSATLNF